MTLQDVIRAIEGVAMSQPAVKMIVENDIFRLNTVQNARYGVFAFVQGQHTASTAGEVINYAFTLFYVDRLTNDRSNQIAIQSTAVQVLNNIVRALDDLGLFVEQAYNFQTFNQRFLDECSGAFCSVTLTVPALSVCPEDWGDNEGGADNNDVFVI